MFKGTKRIAVGLIIMTIIFAALALSGCMPAPTDDGTGSTTGGMMGILPLILIIVIFYFMLIRPQNKKNKQVNEMRSAIKRGDYITTIGGFKGRVVRVKDEVITIEAGPDKVKLEIMRWGISKIDEAAPERKSTKKEREEEIEDDVEEDEDEEQPKRKPKKLTAVPKKEPETKKKKEAKDSDEDKEAEEADEADEADEDDEGDEDEK